MAKADHLPIVLLELLHSHGLEVVLELVLQQRSGKSESVLVICSRDVTQQERDEAGLPGELGERGGSALDLLSGGVAGVEEEESVDALGKQGKCLLLLRHGQMTIK